MAEKRRPRLLIVDDEDVIRILLRRRLLKEGYEIETAANGDEAIALLQKEAFDLVITDLKMPGSDGMEVLRAAKRLHEDIEVVIMTAFASTDTAIGAVREGAFDYLTKPFEHVDEVVHKIKQALQHQFLVRQNQEMLKRLEEMNQGLKKVVISQTRKLNRANDDMRTLLRSLAKDGVQAQSLERLVSGLESIHGLARRLEDTGDPEGREIARAILGEVDDILEAVVQRANEGDASG